MSAAELCPEEVDGRTLEEEEEEIHGTEEHDDPKSCPNNPDLVSFTRETQVENSDGELGDGGCDDVEEFAYEDVLCSLVL